MADFGALNWSIVAVYLVGNLLLGWLMSRRVKTSEDYYLGDRSAPWWAIGVSVVATYVSALSFLGGPAWAYGDGMAALAIHINYPLVIFVVVVFFLPFFYNSGVASIYEYLEYRFGTTSRAVMELLFLLTQSITAASILTATAVVVTFVTGIEATTAVWIMTIIVMIYTLMGGMNAVIWTDVLQGFILFLGAGIILFALFNAVAPVSSAFSTMAEAGKLNPIDTSLDFTVAPTVWAGVLAMTLFHITVYGSNQMMVQRALAAKNIGDAKKSYLMMGYGAFFIYFLFFFIGALLFVHFKGEPFDEPNEIILTFARNLAIPGLMGILAAAVLSASMSSLSSAFNSLATISVVGFYQKYLKRDGDEGHYLLMSRIFTVLWGLAVIPVAYGFIGSGGSILEALSKVGSYFVGAKLALFGMGFFSRHTTERGLLIGVVAGFAGLIVIVGFGGLFGVKGFYPNIAWPWWVVIGGVINIVAAWVASVALDGFRSEWHQQSVPGQIRDYRESKRAQKDGRWYVVPGKVDKPVWGLPVFFLFIILFLLWFATLG
ncbi:MAG: sodium/solute symporter [Hyphomonadaceae bacterium]|nr:sodium/solute symporter [Hyphomonadaceae bacterium]MBC6412146.1 sodium/solute symporter [Hyphomonadaceae bacterium]